MNRKIIIGLMLMSSLSYWFSGDMTEYSVEYVKVCSLYGAGYFYIPGTDSCQQSSTGIVKTQTANGTIISETQLAHRVSELERKIATLMSEKEQS